ncbi:DNA topoisomerase 3 [Algoriphagus sp. H41]|uniref:DNA topoisomerase n=1 Tax=Algoriphagus oliviformis TaxID=2811231 RepID=A0ABS3C8J1_9BACT|nr:type IA DNA topoisomerase [Algoriphagus oliviformis]MBN7813418.1 DNA topoisomerase 3 [Algoriphagus oliviformis]
MKVCIAEKPSVAREIATVLGANSKRDGYFEGNGYIVTYTFGHFCTLLEPNDYEPFWKSWSLSHLPMLPEKFKTKVVDNAGIQKQFHIVKKLFETATEVINCGDAGQEGELIQRWVIEQAGYKGEVKRLWISSLTTEAIREGFEKLQASSKYDNLYYAGYSRAIGDWLLGINATRLYTVKYGGYGQVLSIGRVQTPTLAMIVNRYKEIQNFQPQPYWELQTVYRETTFNCEEGKFQRKEDGEAFANQVKAHDFEVVSVEKKKGRESPPKLFDLTGLQVYCNTKFGLSADETLKIAQQLYEQKVITYPRVDTTFLPNDIYPKAGGILEKLSQYEDLTRPILGKKLKKSAKVFDDKKITDHHAIIPTGVQGSLHGNHLRVYDIIARRFIAVFYEDCLVANTIVHGKVDTVPFKTTGKVILDKGWRVVFESLEKEKKEKDELPLFTKGEKGPHEPSFLQKETNPPKHYTEATLLRAMETAGKQVDDEEMRELMKENGIGRPSTRASIIETLFKRQYIERNKKLILPTETGIQLIDIISNNLLTSAELTGQWEKQLREIEKGNYHAGSFVKNMKVMVEHLVYEVIRENRQTIIAPPSEAKAADKGKPPEKEKTAAALVGYACPKCQEGSLLKGKSSYGCSAYKKGCDFLLPFAFEGKKISENQYLRLLQKGSTVNLKGFKTQSGDKEGLLRLDSQFQLVLEEKKTAIPQEPKNTPPAIPCPQCQKGDIIRGKTAYGCSAYKEGCGFRYPFDTLREKAKGKPLSKELVISLLKESVAG